MSGSTLIGVTASGAYAVRCLHWVGDPLSGEAGRQASWLGGPGTAFGLPWADRQTQRPHRLRRDADGLLLLDVVAGWSWWLRPTPADGAGR